MISRQMDTNKPPWPVPEVVEEQELITQEYIETWIDACKNPDDDSYGDVQRHFGYGAPGGRHLTKDQVLNKYEMFVLQPVQDADKMQP